MVLFVDEKESNRTQLKRGREKRFQNEEVRVPASAVARDVNGHDESLAPPLPIF